MTLVNARRSRFLLVALLCSSASLPALAQTGTVSGSITDSSGGAVPGATVTLTNLGTAAVRTAATDNSGTYSIPNVPVGHYDATVEGRGFSTLRFTNVELTVAQSLTLSGTLQLGPVSQQVEVSETAAAVIDHDDAQLSNVIDQKRILDLPLLTRDPYSLVLLSPGVEQAQGGNGGFSINGQRDRNNNFLLDGVDNNDASVPGIPGGLSSLNPDDTQEFRVITNNFLPEYGRNTGAIISVVTKSGTNEFHGSAYEFNRVYAMAARDFFNPTPEPQNPFVRNDFGFSLGGPIWKDHTFFFVNSEWQRYRTTLTDSIIVPTAAFKTGIFTYQGVPVNLANPASPDNAQGLPLDPTMQKILALYPNPNGPAVDDIRGTYFFPSSSKQDTANVTYRMDHRFSEKYSIFARYTYNGFNDPDPFHDDILPALGSTGTNQQTQSGAFNFIAAFRPNLVNEFRFGLNRTDDLFSCNNANVFDQFSTPDAFGFGTDYSFNTSVGAGTIQNFGCTDLGDSNGQFRRAGTWDYVDNLSWIRGNHSFKFGGEFRYIYDNNFDAFSSRPLDDFTAFGNLGIPVVNFGGPCDPTTGTNCGDENLQTMAAALLGLVGTQSQSQYFNAQGQRRALDYLHFRQHEYGFYGQDVWKMRPNLTLQLGLRWEFDGVPFETSGDLSNLYVDASGPGPFTFETVGPGTGRKLYTNDWHDFEPRVGLSWDPFSNGKTAFRAGYGIFHDRIFGNLFGNARSNPPFVGTVFNFVGAPLSTVPPPATVPTPSATVGNGSFLSPTLIDPNLRTPYSGAWNVGIQRELGWNTVLEVNYVGSSSHRQLRVVDANQPQPALIAAQLAAGVPPESLQGGSLWFSGLSTYNTAFYEPGLTKSIGNATYNGLQTVVTKRLHSGIEFQAAYTWSHAIDDSADPLSPVATARSFPRNSLNLQEERGSSGFDLRHRLVVSYLFELPFGPGHAFLNGAGLLGRIVGGWELSGISTFESGRPYDVFGTRDTEHTGLGSRLDVIAPPVIPPGSDSTQTGPPASDFALAPFGRPGNFGRNTLTGPVYFDTDVDLIKRIRITERFDLQFRAEAYNVFNQVQFSLPGNAFADPGTFGVSTSEIQRPDGTSAARQLQLALKLEF